MYYLKNLTKILFFVLAAAAFLWGCGPDTEKENKEEVENIEEIDVNGPTLFKLNDRLFSVPSPFQVAMLVKETAIPYNKELLNPTNKVSNYTTTFKKALNLGVYGGNLGYLNIYEQLPDAAAYFGVVKVLSNELGILNSFSEQTMKRLEANNNNKDSLMYILSNAYRDADSYLLENDRNDIGVLILAGGWVESMYIMTQTLIQKRDQQIIDRIGEQKHPLDNLIELLRPYYGKQSDEFDLFLEQLVDLATIFDGVVIEYTYEQPTIDPEKKLTTINSRSKTIISEYQLNTITEMVEGLRAKIVD